MIGPAIFDLQLTPGNSGGYDKGTGFDPIGNDRMFRCAERLDTFDIDCFRAGAVNARTHLVQQLSQIDYLGFACRVMKYSRAACERGSHHQVLGSGHGNFGKVNLRRMQTSIVWCASYDVSAFKPHLGTELLKSCKV